eukprot:Sspe_Gene.17617::Locus_6265_Transcript_1_1_Confidence_1.000_Length_3372::g.17617::m.17617
MLSDRRSVERDRNERWLPPGATGPSSSRVRSRSIQSNRSESRVSERHSDYERASEARSEFDRLSRNIAETQHLLEELTGEGDSGGRAERESFRDGRRSADLHRPHEYDRYEPRSERRAERSSDRYSSASARARRDEKDHTIERLMKQFIRRDEMASMSDDLLHEYEQLQDNFKERLRRGSQEDKDVALELQKLRNDHRRCLNTINNLMVTIDQLVLAAGQGGLNGATFKPSKPLPVTALDNPSQVNLHNILREEQDRIAQVVQALEAKPATGKADDAMKYEEDLQKLEDEFQLLRRRNQDLLEDIRTLEDMHEQDTRVIRELRNNLRAAEEGVHTDVADQVDGLKDAVQKLVDVAASLRPVGTDVPPFLGEPPTFSSNTVPAVLDTEVSRLRGLTEFLITLEPSDSQPRSVRRASSVDRSARDPVAESDAIQLRRRVFALQEELDEMRRKRQKDLRVIEDLEDDLQHVRKQYQEQRALASRAMRSTEDGMAKDSDLNRLLAEIEGLENQLREREHELRDKAGLIEDHRARLADAEARGREAEARCQEILAKNRDDQDHYDDLLSELHDLREKNSVLHEELRQSRQVAQDRLHIIERIDQRGDDRKASADDEGLREMVDELRHQLEQRDDEIFRLKSGKEVWEKGVQVKLVDDESLERLADDNELLRRHVDEGQVLLEEARHHGEDLQRHIDGLKQTLEDVKREKEDLNRELDNIARRNEELEQQLLENDQSNGLLEDTEQVAALRRSLAEESAQAHSYREKLEQREKELQDAYDELNAVGELDAELQSLRDENIELKERLKELESQYNRDMEQYEAEMARLEAQEVSPPQPPPKAQPQPRPQPQPQPKPQPQPPARTKPAPKKKKPKYPFLGLELGALRSEIGGHGGLRVIEVHGPAAAAGLLPEDLITEVQNVPVREQSDFRRVLVNHPADKPVYMKLVRDNMLFEVDIQPAPSDVQPGQGAKYTNKVIVKQNRSGATGRSRSPNVSSEGREREAPRPTSQDLRQQANSILNKYTDNPPYVPPPSTTFELRR